MALQSPLIFLQVTHNITIGSVNAENFARRLLLRLIAKRIFVPDMEPSD